MLLLQHKGIFQQQQPASLSAPSCISSRVGSKGSFQHLLSGFVTTRKKLTGYEIHEILKCLQPVSRWQHG